TSALGYIPETAWNDTSAVSMLFSSGGGSSQSFAKPAWQAGNGVPNDGARDVPDISLAASPQHDGYLVCIQGSCADGLHQPGTNGQHNGSLTVFGGTSFGAPTFAGIVALINESHGRQGNVNQVLYPLAAHSPATFHDITTGNNEVPFQPGTPDFTPAPV